MKCMENIDYKVIVHSITYNHSAYITDTMDGFSKQKTTFPFICAIIDDASTDGEQSVIHDYIFKHFKNIEEFEYNYGGKKCADIIFAQHSENVNCFFIAILLLENHYSQKKSHLKREYVKELVGKTEYIALCEGDDYWTDGNKLQEQVDFLDKNTDYSMCFHQALEHYQNENRPDSIFSKIESREYSDIEIFANWIIPTASVVFRKHIVDSDFYHNIIKDQKFYFGDILVFLTCAHFGKIYGISKVMSVYRRLDTGASQFQHKYNSCYKFAQHSYHIQEVFGKKHRIKSDRSTLYGFDLMAAKQKNTIKGRCILLKDFVSISPRLTFIWSYQTIICSIKRLCKNILYRYCSVFRKNKDYGDTEKYNHV